MDDGQQDEVMAGGDDGQDEDVSMADADDNGSTEWEGFSD